jgi:predicted RNA-binding protein with TRAM domain
MDDVHLDHFRVLDRGDAVRLAPKAPVEAGQELELKLGEVGLHDPHAGVGKVKDFEVVVAGAAKLVGKKVKVRVGAVMEGFAYAEPVGVDQDEGPITAEAEAEKPTRVRKGAAEPAKKPAPRKKKPVELEPEPEEAHEELVADEEAVGAEEAVEGAPPKKKTRRGSRGGRGRTKKTAVPALSSNGDQPESAPAPEEAAPIAPVIHLPGRELEDEQSGNGDQPAVPKKRPTRRGSRGGRNRKKKTAASPSAEPEAPPAEDAGSGEWEYTPMSEWGHE